MCGPHSKSNGFEQKTQMQCTLYGNMMKNDEPPSIHFLFAASNARLLVNGHVRIFDISFLLPVEFRRIYQSSI